jgi:Putative peptidoglycan binding domain
MQEGLGRRTRFSVLILLAVLALGGPGAFGGDQPVFRKTLRGLSGVGVRVERLPPEAEQAGMTRRQVQTEVEQRLREGGIRVLTPPELLSAFGCPALAVTIQLAPAAHESRELYGVHITVALTQQVLLERNMTMPAVEAATWEVVALGVVGRDAWPRVREDVAALVDRFIHAYRAVNPAPAARTESRQSSPPAPRAALIRQAQERLAAQGFNPGIPDGQMGATTQAAIRQFQRAHGLPTTGDLDDATQRALGVESK